jgi:hypothetical protein
VRFGSPRVRLPDHGPPGDGAGDEGPGLEVPEVTGPDDEDDGGADVDVTAAVAYGRAVEGVAAAVVTEDGAEAPGIVEVGDDPGPGRSGTGRGGHFGRPVEGQWTILDRGSSMMSVAPLSFSAGMRMFTSALGTTVSTA